jgi:hypothetical protein
LQFQHLSVKTGIFPTGVVNQIAAVNFVEKRVMRVLTQNLMERGTGSHAK